MSLIYCHECHDEEEKDESYVAILNDIMNSHKLSTYEYKLILQYLFTRTSGCKCCKRHSQKKPRRIRIWQENEMQTKRHTPNCKCSCRHVSRQICRILGHE